MKTLINTLLLATAIGAVSTAAYARGGEGYGTTTGNTTSSNQSMTMDNTGVSANTTLSTNQVVDIQQSLQGEGYNIAADGIWGPNTREALRDFQVSNNLDASGSVDQQTLSALDIDTNTFMDNE